MNFKSILEKDVKNVFLNTNEFAEQTEFKIGKTFFNCPISLQNESSDERNKNKEDFGQGIFIYDATMYVALSDIKTIPVSGQTLEICRSGDIYTVKEAYNDCGMIILYLELYDD